MGPFRGARIVMQPRSSLRKVFGFYEQELNPWIEQALRKVTRVIDVGANDGYFTFGSAAAFRRLGKTGEIVAYEPDSRQVEKLRDSVAAQDGTGNCFQIVHSFVGAKVGEGVTTLDALTAANRRDTLVKIDVEGAEMEVLDGANSWLKTGNCFVIEVHQRAFLEQIQNLFQKKGMRLKQVNQKPLALFGREERGEENWWLVTDLDQP